MEADPNDSQARIFDTIFERYPWLRLWCAENGGRRLHALVIMKPGNVRDFHRIVHDYELRERARPLIRREHVCEPSNTLHGDNNVLVIAPIQ